MVQTPISPNLEEKLEQVLIQRSLVSAETMRAVRARARRAQKSVREVLLANQIVTAEALESVEAGQSSGSAEIQWCDVQPEALALVPQRIAQELRVLPISVDRGCLQVAMHEIDEGLVGALRNLTGHQIQSVVPQDSTVLDEIDSHYEAASWALSSNSRRSQPRTSASAHQPTPDAPLQDLQPIEAAALRPSTIEPRPQPGRRQARRLQGKEHRQTRPASLSPAALQSHLEPRPAFNDMESQRFAQAEARPFIPEHHRDRASGISASKTSGPDANLATETPGLAADVDFDSAALAAALLAQHHASGVRFDETAPEVDLNPDSGGPDPWKSDVDLGTRNAPDEGIERHEPFVERGDRLANLDIGRIAAAVVDMANGAETLPEPVIAPQSTNPLDRLEETLKRHSDNVGPVGQVSSIELPLSQASWEVAPAVRDEAQGSHSWAESIRPNGLGNAFKRSQPLQTAFAGQLSPIISNPNMSPIPESPSRGLGNAFREVQGALAGIVGRIGSRPEQGSQKSSASAQEIDNEPWQQRVTPQVQAWIWASAIILFGFVDTLTSLMVFSSGGTEANFVLAKILGIIGPSIWAFVLIKMATTLLPVLVSRVQPKLELKVSLAMLLIGAFLAAQNIAVLVFG